MPCALATGSSITSVSALTHIRIRQHCRQLAGVRSNRPVIVASTGSESTNSKGAPSAETNSDTERESTAKNNLPESNDRSAPARKRRADSSDWIASAVTRRFGLAGGLAWVGVLTFGVLSEQIKTRIEQADEARSTQVVSGAKEVTLPSGVTYTDVKIGGGSPVQKGYLMILDFKYNLCNANGVDGFAEWWLNQRSLIDHYYARWPPYPLGCTQAAQFHGGQVAILSAARACQRRATADGQVFEDTRARGKPIVFLYGGRPFTGGLCKGVEEAMASMRAGGRRTVTVPAAQGFGEKGGQVAASLHAPDKQGVIPKDATLTYDLELIRVSIPPS